MIQIADDKKIMNKIKTVIHYYTASYSVLWEGFLMVGGNADTNMQAEKKTGCEIMHAEWQLISKPGTGEKSEANRPKWYCSGLCGIRPRELGLFILLVGPLIFKKWKIF